MDYAIERAVPAHLEEVRARTLGRLKMVEAAVHDRLTKEINYWDHRADQLKEKELAGKGAKGHLNSGIARQRAEELAERLEAAPRGDRTGAADLGAAAGGRRRRAGRAGRLPGELRGRRGRHRPPIDTTISERIAVDAVMAIERDLGREPEEQDHFNPGYDILSKDPITGDLLLHRGQGPRRRCADRHGHANGDPARGSTRATDSSWRSSRSRMERPAGVHYLADPFQGEPEAYFDMTSVNYDWKKLIAKAGEPA